MEGSLKNIVQTVKIGEHKVQSVGSLIPLEKEPVGNYFGGTNEKKTGKKRITKPHKLKQNLSDFMPECDQNGVEMCSECCLPINATNEMITNLLEERIHEYEQMKEYNDRKCHLQQKLMEENYIKEQEKLAETWKKYFYEKDINSSNDSQPKSPIRKTRYYFRTQKFSNDDKGDTEKEELRLKRKSKQNQSSSNELDQSLDKLMIAEQ